MFGVGVIGLNGSKTSSQTGTRTRVCWVRASYPNHLDYLGRQRPTLTKYITKITTTQLHTFTTNTQHTTIPARQTKQQTYKPHPPQRSAQTTNHKPQTTHINANKNNTQILQDTNCQHFNSDAKQRTSARMRAILKASNRNLYRVEATNSEARKPIKSLFYQKQTDST